MSNTATHKPTMEELTKKWGLTPVTDKSVLEGMAEYKRILNSK